MSEATIEENILLKALEEGQFTTAALFSSVSIRDLVDNEESEVDVSVPAVPNADFIRALAAAEDDDDRNASKAASAEARAEMEEFEEPLPAKFEEAAALSGDYGDLHVDVARKSNASRPSDENPSEGVCDDGDAAELEVPLPAIGRSGDAAKGDAASSDDEGNNDSDSDGSGTSDEASDSSQSVKSATYKRGKRVRFKTNSSRAKPTRTTGVDSSFCSTGRSKTASALDCIDLDALALETSAAEEGLDEDHSNLKTPSEASACSSGVECTFASDAEAPFRLGTL